MCVQVLHCASALLRLNEFIHDCLSHTDSEECDLMNAILAVFIQRAASLVPHASATLTSGTI